MESSRLVNAAFGLANFHAIDDDAFVDTDGEAAGRIDTRPDLVFERCPAWPEIRQRHH